MEDTGAGVCSYVSSSVCIFVDHWKSVVFVYFCTTLHLFECFCFYCDLNSKTFHFVSSVAFNLPLRFIHVRCC